MMLSLEPGDTHSPWNIPYTVGCYESRALTYIQNAETLESCQLEIPSSNPPEQHMTTNAAYASIRSQAGSRMHRICKAQQSRSSELTLTMGVQRYPSLAPRTKKKYVSSKSVQLVQIRICRNIVEHIYIYTYIHIYISTYLHIYMNTLIHWCTILYEHSLLHIPNGRYSHTHTQLSQFNKDRTLRSVSSFTIIRQTRRPIMGKRQGPDVWRFLHSWK